MAILQKRKLGFTLIELLVVLAIIGLLSSIALVSLSGARKKARDAKRWADIRGISTAMEMYYSSQSPESYYLVPAQTVDPAANVVTAIGTAPNIYMVSVPTDPSNSGDQQYKWWSNSADTQVYCVYTKLENEVKWVAASEAGVIKMNAAPTSVTACP